MKHLLTALLAAATALTLSNAANAQSTVKDSVYYDDACGDIWAGQDALASNLNTSSSSDCAGLNIITTEGVANTAYGYQALIHNTTGSFNTSIGPYSSGSDTTGVANLAIGYAALFGNVSGSYNLAIGHDSMEYGASGLAYNVGVGAYTLSTSTGMNNVAVGHAAMQNSTTANNDTAVGFETLFSNSTGGNDTAFGYNALYSNTTGTGNNAIGEGALQANTTANDNNAMGVNALHNNSTGTLNNAMGNYAMEFNTIGNNNNAVGYAALLHNTTGSDNSGQGYEALVANTTGNLNIAIGYKAGANLTTGSNNIDIGNVGVAAETGIIRIGTQGTQSAAFMGGVAGTNISGGVAVMVSSTGQLGVVSSSRRYKQDIQPMGTLSERLYQLQPVTFRYKQPDADGKQPIQVGLIAEDVAAVMPELAVYNSDGQPESVAYHLLPTLLLNELQKEHQLVMAQAQQLKNQELRVAELTAQAADVKAMKAQLAELQHLTAQLAARQDTAGARLDQVAQVAAAE